MSTATLSAALAPLLLPGESLLATFRSDITFDGHFGHDAVVALTDRRLIVQDPSFAQGHTSLDLASVEKLEILILYGNSLMRAVTTSPDRQLRELIRFSRSLDAEAEAFVEEVHAQITRISGRPIDLDAAGEHNSTGTSQQGRCRSCGRSLPRDQDLCHNCIDKRRLARRSLRYLARYPGATAWSFGLTLAITLLQLVPTYLTKIMIDDVLIPRRIEGLWWIIGGILLIHALLSVLSGLHSYAINWLGNKVVVDLRTEVYAKLQQLTLTFYDKRQTGWIMSRVTNDTSFLQHFMVHGLQQIIVHFLMVAGIAAILFAMNWRLALVTLLPLPLVAWGTSRFSKKMHKVYHRIWRRISNMHAMLGDTIPGIRVVKAFTRENDEIERFAEKNMEVLEENMKAIRVTSVFFPAMGFTMAVGTIALWAIGGYRVITVGDLQPGELIAFIGYTGMLYNPIQALSRSSEQVQGAVTAAERLFEIVDTQPEVDETEDKGIVLDDIQGRIEFKNVSFHYEKGDPVLQNINFTIEPGQMIGLVGSSGSGKSTLINLIARFYQVTEGEILLDGHNLNSLDLAALRRNIGMVLQEPFLFHGTIAENIAYGRPDASLDDIVAAARLANAHRFIMNLPDGYDTRIGERGVGLSGGEKQRISIARAILKDPKILILDEATSAVDTETEKLIQEALDRLVSGRTTIAIAHRLSTLQNADRLLVMKDGHIVEEGTHEELLSKPDGVFRRLVEMQQEVAKSRVIA